MTEAIYVTAGSITLAIVLGVIVGWFLKKSLYREAGGDVIEAFEAEIKDKDKAYAQINEKYADIKVLSERIEAKNREFVQQSTINSDFLRDSQKKNSVLSKEVLILQKDLEEATKSIEYHEEENQKNNEILSQYKSEMELKENEHALLKAEIANNASKVEQSKSIINLFDETYEKIKNT